jgi:cell division initiation protein
VVREAQAEGERILEEARAGVRRLQEELDALDRSRRTYLAQMRTLIARQLSEVEASDTTPPPASGRGGSRASKSQEPREE